MIKRRVRMIYQAMQLHVCREAGGQYWNLGQGKREDISRTQKLIISLDRFHLSRSDRAAAERAGMLYSSQSGIHICRETSSTICSNFSFIKMELNFIRINHIQLEIWGAGEKNCAWLKRKKKGMNKKANMKTVVATALGRHRWPCG